MRCVRVHHPLQQGLRRELSYFYVICCLPVRVHHPLQQGLRLGIVWLKIVVTLGVRVHHPLQQGLRLFIFLSFKFSKYVRVHHPLQQGLRQQNLGRFELLCQYSASASSITTRIKTMFFIFY